MRGRRYINLGEFELAAADFAMAARLLPENWYVWYHLGLCNLILGDLERAKLAYDQCAMIPTTRSLDVALRNWRWITYMRLGEKEKAAALLEDVDASWDMDGTDNYLRLLLLYKGALTPEEAAKIPEGDEEPILSATTPGLRRGQLLSHSGRYGKLSQCPSGDPRRGPRGGMAPASASLRRSTSSSVSIKLRHALPKINKRGNRT